MASLPRFPVPTVALGRVAVGDVLWRHRGERRLTIIVKACFKLVPNAPMVLIAPDPIRVVDWHYDGSALASVAHAGEVAPRRSRVDVVLTGEAHAPKRATRVNVRLAIHEGSRPLLDKTIRVVGRRATADAEPEPFSAMPLRYERAFGGVGHDANPIGVGYGKSDELPNLLAADGTPVDEPACLAPVPATFPRRRALRGALSAKAAHAMVTDLGNDFDFDYYQTAPRDQQLDQLPGDSWITLEGFGAEGGRLLTQLPGAKALVRVWLETGSVDVATALDTVALDVQHRNCVLLWRGETVVAGEGDHDSWLAAGALSFPGVAHQWPSRAELEEGVPVGESLDGTVVLGAGKRTRTSEAEPKEASLEGTVALSNTQHRRAGAHAPIPFPTNTSASSQPGSDSPIPGAPWSGGAAPEVPLALGEQTLLATSSADDDGTSPSADGRAGTADRTRQEDERAAQQQAEDEAAAEAAARREREAQRFREEQAEARRAEAERERQDAERKRAEDRTLRKSLYGFKKPK